MSELIETKCEYCVNPIGIDCVHPRLSWKLPQGGTQTAYRVLVSASREMLEAGKGDLFDTGIVSSDSAFFADYGGKELASRQKCLWQVWIYSGENCIKSPVSSFETGLLHESDWKGTWMGMSVRNQGGTVLFRKPLALGTGKAVRARAYVCALGLHEAFFNGKKLGNAVLQPAVSEYESRVFYCTYDLTPLLTEGENVFGLEVGHGWYGSRKALVQIYVDYADGTVKEFHSSVNGGWMVGGSCVLDNSIYDGEVYDARIEEKVPADWASVSYDPTWDRGWISSVYTAPPRGRLQAQPLEPIAVTGTFPALSVTEKGKGVRVYDIGRNIAGWARIRVRGERGSRVLLKFGERLTDDGFVDRRNLRSARASDLYILKGEGVEEYAPRFTYHGFQYVQAETEGDCEILSLVGEHVHTDVRMAGSFHCSDETVNRMHENAAVTELNNQHGILTDCPQRDERFGWLNDLGSRLYQTVYNCGMERFFPKFTADIADGQSAEGAIGDTAPYYTGGQPADPVSVAYLLMPVFCYTYYGDNRCAERFYEGCKAWTDYLLSRSRGYIMEYSYYGDWVEPAPDKVHTDNIFMSTVCLFWHLKLMSKIAEITGRVEVAAEYAQKAEACAAAINEKYFDKSSCRYAGGTQTADAMALNLGIVPEFFREKVAAAVAADVVARGYHSTCGNVGYRHMFCALGDYGYFDVFLKMLKNPEYPGWGFMLANGATSVWERWESEMSDAMDSFDHPMFGSYDACFYRYLGGIRVDDDACGCDKITIEPVFASGIEEVNASFDTVRGKILSEWKRKDNRVTLKVSIPATVTAKIRFDGKTSVVRGGNHEFSAELVSGRGAGGRSSRAVSKN